MNAAPAAGEGDRLHRMLSAMIGAGIKGGYLASPLLAEARWQAGDRLLPAPAVTTAGESPLWVDPAEIPAGADVARLGRALAAGRGGDRDELMASLAACSGLRWGELAALTISQVALAARVITVDRKVVEVGGRLFAGAPKNRKFRSTVYPRRTPGGYPLAGRLAARRTKGTKQAGQPGKVPDRADRAGRQPLGQLPPSGRPVTSMRLRSPPTAPASGRAGRCPSAGWQRPAARPHGGGRVTGWPKPGTHPPRPNRVRTGPSAGQAAAVLDPWRQPSPTCAT